MKFHWFFVLFRQFFRSKTQVVTLFVLSIWTSMLTVSIPMLYTKLIEIVKNQDIKYSIGIFFPFFIFMHGLSDLLKQNCVLKLRLAFLKNTMSLIIDKLFQHPYIYQKKIGEILSLFSRDIDGEAKYIYTIEALLYGTFTVIFASILGIKMYGFLFLLVIMMNFITIPITQRIGRHIYKYQKKTIEKGNERVNLFEQIWSNGPRILFSGLYLQLEKKLLSLRKKETFYRFKRITIWTQYQIFILSLKAVIVCASWFLIHSFGKSLVATDFLAILLFIEVLEAPIQNLAFSIKNIYEGKNYWEQIDRFISERKSIVDDRDTTREKSGKECLVDLESADTILLVGKDPKMNEKVALEIAENYLNGKNRKHKKIGYAFSSPNFFEGSVAENLFIDNEESFYNLKQLCALDWVSSSENHIEKFGENLSGGQKKRLEFARVANRNWDILILDEPFSEIDKNNAIKIYEQLVRQFWKNIPVIITCSLIHPAFEIAKQNLKIFTISESGKIELPKEDDSAFAEQELSNVCGDDKSKTIKSHTNIEKKAKLLLTGRQISENLLFSIRYFFNAINQQKKYVLILLLFITTLSSFITVSQYSIFTFLSEAVNRYSTDSIELFWWFVGGFLLISFTDSLLSSATFCLWAKSIVHVATFFIKSGFHTIVKMEQFKRTDLESGEVLTLFSKDIHFLENEGANVFSTLLTSLFFVCIVAVSMIFYHWLTFLFFIVITPCCFIFLKRYGEEIVQYNIKRAQSMGKVIDSVKEITHMDKWISIYGKKDLFFKKSTSSTKDYILALKQFSKKQINTLFLIESVKSVFVLFCIIIPLYLVNNLSPELIAFYLFIGLKFFSSISKMTFSLGLINSVAVSLRRFNQFFNYFDNIKYTQKACTNTLSKANHHSNANQYALSFHNVTAGYKDYDNTILENISFDIPKNCIFGINGKSGIGKTTIWKILTNEATLFKGDLFIYGKNYNAWNKKDLLETMSIVPQNLPLFSMTLEEHICLDEKQSLENMSILLQHKMTKAIFQNTKNASDGNFINNSSHAIFIHLLRNYLNFKPLVILDEPTAYCNHFMKKDICSIIKDMKKKSTIVLISHDAQTLGVCDKIFSLS